MRTAREAWARRARRLALLVCGLAIASPSSAARLVDVRVGHHPEFTRIVLQLDERASYRIDSPAAGASPELRLTVGAESRPVRLVPPRWTHLVRAVRVDPAAAGAARVRIALDRAEVRVAEQVLERPPRIVIDVYAATGAAPAAPEPTRPEPPAAEAEPGAEAPPAPVAEPEAVPPAAESEVAPAPEPEPEAAPLPQEPAPASPEAAPAAPPVEAAPSPTPGWTLLIVLGALALLAAIWLLLARQRTARIPEAATESVVPPVAEPTAPRPTAPPPLPPRPLAEEDAQALRPALHAIEQRLAAIEARLDDVLDWRERSTRSLEAQMEELRVQRATLSRVRRIVRAIARPEDLIGETRSR